jgi:uncharacterized membrane protein
MKLYEHIPHSHKPVNTNERYKLEQTGFNARLAVILTQHVGSMWTAYLFTIICFIGLGAILGWLPNTLYWIIMWLTSSFLSLTILPIIMVGQNILGKKSEMQAEEQFNTTQKSYHDLGEVGKHLSAQDEELLKQTRLLLELVKHD